MRHFFVDEKPVVGERAILCEEDRDHLLRVLRAKEGDVLQIAWNESLFRGTLEIIGGEAFVRVEEAVEEKDVSTRLFLAQGVGKNQKTETVLKHATECGIDGFIPLQMDRSVSNLTKKYEGKKARFEKIAEEAAKQSNRRRVPVVGDLLTVDGLIAATGRPVPMICSSSATKARRPWKSKTRFSTRRRKSMSSSGRKGAFPTGKWPSCIMRRPNLLLWASGSCARKRRESWHLMSSSGK